MTKIVDDGSYSQEEVLRELRALGYWFAAERVQVQANEPGAEDWRIILTPPNGAGAWCTLDDIGKHMIDVRWYGGDMLEDCPLIAKLNPERGG
jgi:hypothetical protein